MPDIIKDYSTLISKCKQEDTKCNYDIDDTYEFIYQDGIAEIIPIRKDSMTKHAPKYHKRPPKDQDGFISENFPHLKQRTKFVVTVVLIILLILVLIGIFFTYEVYYVFFKKT
jgi:hypothetical protein